MLIVASMSEGVLRGTFRSIYGEVLLRVSPQDIVILPHHNILLHLLILSESIDMQLFIFLALLPLHVHVHVQYKIFCYMYYYRLQNKLGFPKKIFAICTSTFCKLCRNVYNNMQKTAQQRFSVTSKLWLFGSFICTYMFNTLETSGFICKYT
jgi:hypothetical protein